MAITPLLYDLETLFNATAAWRQYLAVEKGLAPRTVAAYTADVTRFQKWLKTVLDKTLSLTDSINLRVMRAYVRYLGTTRACKSAAIARAVAALKSLSTWAAREGAIAADVAKDLDRPKVVPSLPAFLAQDALTRLVEWTAHHRASSGSQARDRALVVFFCYTGARLSEVANARASDFDAKALAIRLHGKGRKDRIVPVARAAAHVLRAWLRLRPPSPWLFPGGADGRLHVRTIERIVARASLAALGKPVSPHTLRHSYATLLHRAGVTLRDLQQLLGHASIATTQVYLHTDPAALDHVRTIDIAGLTSTPA
jgi:integrase/recombinase XerD